MMRYFELGIVLLIGMGAGAVLLLIGRGPALWLVPVAVAATAILISRRSLKRGSDKPTGSSIPWWLYLWYALFLSGLVFRVRDTATILESPLDAWGMYRAALVASVAFLLFARLGVDRRVFGPPFPSGPLRWLLLYALIALVSTAWSVHPLWTFYKSSEYLVDLSLAVAICATIAGPVDVRRLFSWTWTMFACLASAVVVSAVAWPDLALRRDIGLIGVQLSGVLPILAANAVGDIGALLSCVAATRLLLGSRAKLMYGSVLIGSLALLFLSQSRTPLAGCIAGVGCTLLHVRKRKLALCAVLATAGLVMLTPAGDVIWAFVARGQSPELIFSATGRTKLWSVSWNLFQQRPLLGHGAMASTRFLVSAEQPWGDVAYSQADNTYVEVLGGLGIVGLVPLLGCLASTWLALMRQRNNPLLRPVVIEAMSVLSLLTLRSFFTAGGFIWHPSLTFISIVICADVASRIAKIEQNSRIPNLVIPKSACA